MRAFGVLALVLLAGCASETPREADAVARDLDSSGRDDASSGGVKMIPITTPRGTFRVWTKRVGSNPRIKLLLLHGGPGCTHEYFEIFDSFLPAAGVEYYYYDQLGSSYSDQPDATELWTIPRFVDEVEQVRQALGLDRSNFFLLGHSWGGMLAIEYALAHGAELKGLVISNMMASIPAYNAYATRVLKPQIDPAVLAEIEALEAAGRYDERYEQLLVDHHYVQHVLRLPADRWPEPVQRSFAHLNKQIYVRMQGPSELGAKGTLEAWDRVADLPRIAVPTLVIGARHDTMEPAHMQAMAEAVPRARYLFCPNGSHMAMYDDTRAYLDGLIAFLHDVDQGKL